MLGKVPKTNGTRRPKRRHGAVGSGKRDTGGKQERASETRNTPKSDTGEPAFGTTATEPRGAKHGRVGGEKRPARRDKRVVRGGGHRGKDKHQAGCRSLKEGFRKPKLGKIRPPATQQHGLCRQKKISKISRKKLQMPSSAGCHGVKLKGHPWVLNMDRGGPSPTSWDKE